MRGLWLVLRELVPKRAVQVLGTAVVVGAVLAFVGLDLDHSIFIATGIAIVGVTVAVLTGGGQASPGWLPAPPESRGGTRLEVAALSWTLLGRSGRVGEGAVRKLREVAAARLARRGLDMDDPDDHQAIRELLGPDVWRVMTTNATLPTRREVERCVQALEAADPARPADLVTTAAGPAPHPPDRQHLTPDGGPTP